MRLPHDVSRFSAPHTLALSVWIACPEGARNLGPDSDVVDDQTVALLLARNQRTPGALARTPGQRMGGLRGAGPRVDRQPGRGSPQGSRQVMCAPFPSRLPAAIQQDDRLV